MKNLALVDSPESLLTKIYNVRNLKSTLESVCFSQARKFGYTKMFIDDFSNSTTFALDAGTPALTYDSTNGIVSNQTIAPGLSMNTVNVPQSSGLVIASLMIVPISDNTIQYSYSTNGGTTWSSEVNPNTNIVISGSPTQVMVRAQLNQKAELYGWGILIREA